MDWEKASAATKKIYRAVGMMPFSCATDIALLTDIDQNTVANVLRRGELGPRRRRESSEDPTQLDETDLLFSVKMGRVRNAVRRYAYSYAGALESERELGVQLQWFNSANGLRAIASQLPLAEVLNRVMPHLPSLPAVEEKSIRLVNGEGKLGTEYWRFYRMEGFWWLRSGPFRAIARFELGISPGLKQFLPAVLKVYVPVAYFGPFHTAQHLRGLRDRLGRMLEMPMELANSGEMLFGDWRPPIVVIVPDPLSGVRVRQMLEEAREPVAACIIDLQERVLQPLGKATCPWIGFKDPAGDGPPGLPSRFRLGIPHELKPELEQGAFAALNGVDRWRLYRDSVVLLPMLPVKDLAQTSDLPEPRVRTYLKDMDRADVVLERASGYCPAEKGWSVLAASEGVTLKSVENRLGVYLDKNSTFPEQQQAHSIGTARTLVGVRRNGVLAYPVLLVPAKRYGDPRRVNPDGGLVLASGQVILLEYEQSARSKGSATNKLAKYVNLNNVGLAVPVCVVTPDPKAALNFVRVRQNHVLATTLDRALSGPYGAAELNAEGQVVGTPGVWGYWYKNQPAPSFNVPLDMWDKVRSYPQWRVSLTHLRVEEWSKPAPEELRLFDPERMELQAEYDAMVEDDLRRFGEL